MGSHFEVSFKIAGMASRSQNAQEKTRRNIAKRRAKQDRQAGLIPKPTLHHVERKTKSWVTIATTPSVENLNKCHDQRQSLLFSALPGELRNVIFYLALTRESCDVVVEDGRYTQDGLKGHTLLMCCRRAWLEGNHIPMSTCRHRLRGFVPREEFHYYFDRLTHNNLALLDTVVLEDMPNHFFEAMAIQETSEVFFGSSTFVPKTLVIRITDGVNDINLRTFELVWLDILLRLQGMELLDLLAIRMTMRGPQEETWPLVRHVDRMAKMSGEWCREYDDKGFSNTAVRLKFRDGWTDGWEEMKMEDGAEEQQVVRYSSITVNFTPTRRSVSMKWESPSTTSGSKDVAIRGTSPTDLALRTLTTRYSAHTAQWGKTNSKARKKKGMVHQRTYDDPALVWRNEVKGRWSMIESLLELIE